MQLAIVFGYVGFNQISVSWKAFAAKHPKLPQVRDPLTLLADRAFEWSPGKCLWFVAVQKKHGMTDVQLTDALDTAFSWASPQGIESVATNGVANTNHGLITAENRCSDEVQAIGSLQDLAKLNPFNSTDSFE